jgi:thermostable 8-oxoguanine DNA glycosylase
VERAQVVYALEMLVELLLEEGVETEADLARWLARPGSLERLRRVKGIKDKTANYLQILVGDQTVAIDRHLFRFLAEAGAATTDYGVAHAAITAAAEQLGVPVAVLDHNIWRYMSERPPTG